MSHPDGLPDLFLDRSLGRKVVPLLLRDEGLRLITLAEHYGIPADETIADEEWLELAGAAGWAVLMKDTRIRYNRAEREAAADLPPADLPARAGGPARRAAGAPRGAGRGGDGRGGGGSRARPPRL